jgi:hypothetical protein
MVAYENDSAHAVVISGSCYYLLASRRVADDIGTIECLLQYASVKVLVDEP